MQIDLLLSPSKKNKAPKQFWIRDDKLNQFKVYKNMEHTLELSGQPNAEFDCTLSHKTGNLTINYKAIENLEVKPVNSDYINKQFTEEADVLVKQGHFNDDGKFYIKITGYCKQKPATLRIRLEDYLHLDVCETFIQFASDALIKALRKRKTQSLSENREDIMPKPKKQKMSGLSVISATSCPEFILETMNDNINMTAPAIKANYIQVVPKFENTLVIPAFRDQLISIINRKLHDINRLNTKLNQCYSGLPRNLHQLNEIKTELESLQNQLFLLLSEQLPLTIHYVFERQAQLHDISDRLFNLQESIYELATKMDSDSDNITFTSMLTSMDPLINMHLMYPPQ